MEEASEELMRWKQKAESNGEALRAQAAQAVVEWKWSDAWLWRPAPFWFERGEYPRGKLIPGAPESPQASQFCSGFDAKGNLLIERIYSSIVREGIRWYDETVYRHEPETVRWFQHRYSPDRDLQRPDCRVERGGMALLRGGRVQEISYFGGKRTWSEHFDWSVTGLLRITRMDEDRVEEVDLDADGRIVEARTLDAGRDPWVRWRRPNPEQTFEALGAKVRDSLLSSIPNVAGSLQPDSPAYCLAISYDDEGNDLFMPVIGIGLDCERKTWQKEHGNELKDYLWNPAEFANFASNELDIVYPGSREDIRMFNQIILHERRCEDGIGLLREVARELNKLDWANLLSVTDDFIVYTVGTELCDIEADLLNVLGRERLEELRSQGLIP